MNLIIRRLADGKEFTDSQNALAKLWTDERIIHYKPEEEMEDELPEEYQAHGFAVQFEDGECSIVAWYEDIGIEPLVLKPSKYELIFRQ